MLHCKKKSFDIGGEYPHITPRLARKGSSVSAMKQGAFPPDANSPQHSRHAERSSAAQGMRAMFA